MQTPSPYDMRPLLPSDEAFLREMLYVGLYVREGQEAFSKDIVDKPELSKYYQDWGRPLDLGFVLLHEEKAIGMVSCRLFTAANQGYGYIDGSTPEMNIAIQEGHRNKGLGTRLMKRLFQELRNRSVKAISLSVDAENPAFHLYRKLGFEKVIFDGNSHTLRKSLDTKAKPVQEVLMHFLNRPGMYIQPVDKTTVVAFMHGVESVTDPSWRLTKMLSQHLDLVLDIPQTALGWPNQIQRYADQKQQVWWEAFVDLSREILEQNNPA